jgi:FixJ family two-component response regulator
VAFSHISSNSMGSVIIIGQLAARTTVQRMAIGMMKKVLVSVVEDDRSFRESMCRLMRSLGYTVESFSSATEFLASASLAETACLIADVHMPVMTGLELYRRLIDTGHVIPTILVTAFPNDVDRARALNDGVVCYLRKPVDEEHLTQCVCAALRFGDPSGPD